MKNILSICILLCCFFSIHSKVYAEVAKPANFHRTEAPETPIQTTTSISQHGITWTFADPVQYGQFINGDYWVVNPGSGVRIVGISPGYTTSPRAMNGSMVNPEYHYYHNGYDSYPGYWVYNASLNVGIGVSPSTPLVITSNQSLVSTICDPNYANDHSSGMVKTVAVLTCLSSAPPAGTFRPAAVGSVKTLHNISSVDRSIFKSLPCPVTKPNIATYASYLQMFFLDHCSYTAEHAHPADNGMDAYYYPITLAEMLLMLNLDYTPAEKENLMVGYIQLGIDEFGLVNIPHLGYSLPIQYGFPPNGGHQNGRKAPILVAGLLLNYAPMLQLAQKTGDYLYSSGYGPGNPPPDMVHFGEDGQTFYVTQADVNRTNSAQWNPDDRTAPNYPYTTAMIGMPEFGIRHSTEPYTCDASWYANYRAIGTGGATWTGLALVFRIMGYKTLWNNNAFFDYADRYMAVSRGYPDPNGYTVPGEYSGWQPNAFMRAMWDEYRDTY